MKLVIKCHIELDTDMSLQDVEQELHDRIRQSTEYVESTPGTQTLVDSLKIDDDNTFVNATPYEEYFSPENFSDI